MEQSSELQLMENKLDKIYFQLIFSYFLILLKIYKNFYPKRKKLYKGGFMYKLSFDRKYLVYLTLIWRLEIGLKKIRAQIVESTPATAGATFH